MIQVNGLTKRYGGKTVVDHLSFSVDSGKILTVLGPNGAGKTSTIRMMMGLVEPEEGSVRIGGATLKDRSALRRQIGATFEHPGLYFKMKAGEYLRYFGRLYGVSGRLLEQRIEKYTHLFQLDNHGDKQLGTFSRGMQQKVALCRALIHEPPVLLLDEPTSGLDPGASYDLRLKLKQLCSEEERAVLLCTHVLEEADQLADEIMVLNAGRVVAHDQPEQLKALTGGQWEFELRCFRAAPEVATILEELSFLQDIVSDEGQAAFRFITTDPEKNPEILRCLLDRGIPILSLTPLKRSLEEVYLELTRGGEAR